MIYRDVKKFSGFEKVLVELENDCLKYNEKNLEKCYMISGDGKHKLPAVIGKYDETSKKYICHIDKQIKSMVKNSYISIHNHPDNLTFSGADLYLFLKYDKIKQMRVVTANDTYILEKTNKTKKSYLSEDRFLDLSNKFLNLIYFKFKKFYKINYIKVSK